VALEIGGVLVHGGDGEAEGMAAGTDQESAVSHKCTGVQIIDPLFLVHRIWCRVKKKHPWESEQGVSLEYQANGKKKNVEL